MGLAGGKHVLYFLLKVPLNGQIGLGDQYVFTFQSIVLQINIL